MKTQLADNLLENPYNPLTKKYIKDFLFTLRHTEHPIFALLFHLSAEQFAIVRYCDYKREKAGTDNMAKVDYYTIGQFYETAATFHKQDKFRILFGKNVLYFECELTIPKITALFERFLQEKCETGLRSDKPVCLTLQQIREYGLSRNDIKVLRACLADYNTVAQNKIQAEYDTLKNLCCIRK